MKGLFIPEITAEMFRNGCLESIEQLMAEGEIYDIDYPLEQEPSKDTISREKLIKDLNFLYNEDGFIKDPRAKRTIEVIMEQSSVNPQESNVGRWIYKNGIRYCKFCGASNSTAYTNYCPNCGVKMVEPQESEE